MTGYRGRIARSLVSARTCFRTVLFPTPEAPEITNIFPLLTAQSSFISSSGLSIHRAYSVSVGMPERITWSVSIKSTAFVLRP